MTLTANKIRNSLGVRVKNKRPQPPAPVIRLKKPKKVVPIDALRHPSLERQDPRYIPLGPELETKAVILPDHPKEVALLPSRHPASRIPSGKLLPERRRQRGADALLGLFAKWHMTLELVDGQLVASNPGGGQLVDSAMGLLRDATPLLQAHLAGDPLRCAWPHKGERPVAVTLTEPSMLPICGPHLDGDAKS